jgi:hypothetical protein
MKKEIFAFFVISSCCLLFHFGIISSKGFHFMIFLENIMSTWMLLKLFPFDLALFYIFGIMFVLFLFRKKLINRA